MEKTCLTHSECMARKIASSHVRDSRTFYVFPIQLAIDSTKTCDFRVSN